MDDTVPLPPAPDVLGAAAFPFCPAVEDPPPPPEGEPVTPESCPVPPLFPCDGVGLLLASLFAVPPERVPPVIYHHLHQKHQEHH